MTERVPITDVAAWLEGQTYTARTAIAALAELLSGVAAAEPDDDGESAEQFTRRHLGRVPQLVVEEDDLSSSGAVATALAVGELIAEHHPELGPAMHADPHSWTATEIGGDRLRHPLALRAHFPAGTVSEHACIIVLKARPNHGRPSITVLVLPQHQDEARAVMNTISARAAELNPFRGRLLRASVAGGLSFDVIDLPTALSRSTAYRVDQLGIIPDLRDSDLAS